MSLTWFWLSLYFAFWTSIGTSIFKRLTTTMDFFFLMLIDFILLLPVMSVIILLSGGFPNVSLKFYELILISSIIDILAAISALYAIKISPISLISPISSFNPVFTTIIAALIIREILSPVKLLGILIVVVGAYLLNAFDIKGGFLMPFKKLLTNRGILLFLLANLLWAVTPVFQKQAIFETNPRMPIFPSFFEAAIITLIFLPIVFIKTKNKTLQLKNNWKFFIPLTIFGPLAQWAAFTAFSVAPLGLVTSIFKLSVLFTILWGFLFFKEERIWERLLGAGVMISGTFLLLK